MRIYKGKEFQTLGAPKENDLRTKADKEMEVKSLGKRIFEYMLKLICGRYKD